jgi:hypothetical protein
MGSHHRAQPHEKVWARPMITKAEDSGVCGAESFCAEAAVKLSV